MGAQADAAVTAKPDYVTQLLLRWQSGDAAALDALLPFVYADLRAMAAQKLLDLQGHPTLQPTALVHDVFIRLLEARQWAVANGEHFLHVAGRIMRQILIDRARRAAADKRGGEWQREDLHAALKLPIPEQTDLALLDDAINALERVDERLARIVELRYFVGLSVPAVARVLDVDERTVYRDWALARVWLRDHLENG